MFTVPMDFALPIVRAQRGNRGTAHPGDRDVDTPGGEHHVEEPLLVFSVAADDVHRLRVRAAIHVLVLEEVDIGRDAPPLLQLRLECGFVRRPPQLELVGWAPMAFRPWLVRCSVSTAARFQVGSGGLVHFAGVDRAPADAGKRHYGGPPRSFHITNRQFSRATVAQTDVPDFRHRRAARISLELLSSSAATNP